MDLFIKPIDFDLEQVRALPGFSFSFSYGGSLFDHRVSLQSSAVHALPILSLLECIQEG